MYTLKAGRPLVRTPEETRALRRSVTHDEPWAVPTAGLAGASPEFKAALSAMLVPDASRRLSAEAVLRLPAFVAATVEASKHYLGDISKPSSTINIFA
jgi:hypothetical protein